MSAIWLIAAPLLLSVSPNELEYFTITVVDQETGRGIPLVELRTVNDMRFWTDSNGMVAFCEPGLMGEDIFFHVASHGYEYPEDGFSYRGKRLKPVAGGGATLKMKRINIAERLYRVTGAGIYRDSLLANEPVPIERPTLNGLVFGSDSVVNAVYQGRIYWFWGDTNRPSYPLGNFHVPGATSALPASGGLDPELGVDLEYFVNGAGFAKPTCQMPGQGPTWINGLVVLNDGQSGERLFASYVKVAKPMRIYERGLVEFDNGSKQFEKRVVFDMDAPAHPGGHPFLHMENGTKYVYFVNPYPTLRVEATAEAIQDLSRYESYTCFTQGSRPANYELDRDADGALRFAWRTDTLPLTHRLQQTLIKEQKMTADEGLFDLRDVESGDPVVVHGASVYWNAHLDRWVMIALEKFGSSALGELWFSAADTPLGPWKLARKIVTHDRYSFYNPKQHPMLDKDGGRIIFFEGTYTAMFSGNSDRTPRYNYNQIMYKLDLSDPRLRAVWETSAP